MGKSDVMLPDEFERHMLDLEPDGDTEGRHCAADDLLCDVLEALGYDKGIAIFREMTKWYA